MGQKYFSKAHRVRMVKTIVGFYQDKGPNFPFIRIRCFLYGESVLIRKKEKMRLFLLSISFPKSPMLFILAAKSPFLCPIDFFQRKIFSTYPLPKDIYSRVSHVSCLSVSCPYVLPSKIGFEYFRNSNFSFCLALIICFDQKF